jgi:hypothetical protein
VKEKLSQKAAVILKKFQDQGSYNCYIEFSSEEEAKSSL